MKKAMIVGLCMAAALVAAAEMKVGTVNLETLIKNHPNHESNRTLVKSTADDYRKKMEGLQRKLYALQQEMRADDQHYQEELADLQQRLFKIEKKDVAAKIAVFAKEQGYDLIVDVAACGFSKPDLDVTEDVLKKMGVEKNKADK